MREVSSQVLQSIGPVLQLAGQGSTLTHFEDGNLQQVLDVSALVRRGGTIAPSEGLFGGAIISTHFGAGQVAGSLDPYALGTSAIAPFPAEIPDHLDFWFGMPTASPSVAATIVTAMLSLNAPAARRAYGAAAGGRMPVVGFKGEQSFVASAIYLTRVDLGGLGNANMMRVPRGFTIDVESDATAAVTLSYAMLVGLFPSGLGQDAVG